tara:strand:- start:2592 stop:3287 length:696 start_codon:yes stop_codon:yes gene_type:complete
MNQKITYNLIWITSLTLLIYLAIGIEVPNNKNLKLQYTLLLIYSLVCFLRAFNMTDENENWCIRDSYFVKPYINRTLATIGEICITIFLINAISYISNRRFNKNILYIIILAQILCWIGVINNEPKFNFMEEFLWVLFFGYLFLKIVEKKGYKTNKIITLGVFLYILYMISVDIPYYKNLKISNKRSIFECNWNKPIEDDWGYSMIWQGLYYTIAVIFFIYIYKQSCLKKQ